MLFPAKMAVSKVFPIFCHVEDRMQNSFHQSLCSTVTSPEYPGCACSISCCCAIWVELLYHFVEPPFSVYIYMYIYICIISTYDGFLSPVTLSFTLPQSSDRQYQSAKIYLLKYSPCYNCWDLLLALTKFYSYVNSTCAWVVYV